MVTTLLVLTLAVIGIGARLTSGFLSNDGARPFRLPGEPQVPSVPGMTKQEAITITGALLFPLIAMIVLAGIFLR